MKLALFADLHLDASFRWATPTLARRRRQDLRQTLKRIMDRSLDAEVDAILCAGDLFEQEYVTPDTQDFLRDTFRRAEPTPVYIAPGNHDWISPRSPYVRMEWSSNVHVFEEDRLKPVELSEGLLLWGGAHRAPANTDDFLASFEVKDRGVNLALFHGSERNWLMAQSEGKQPHAPFDAEEVRRAGFVHAFVGHYHKPKDSEFFTYPGNPEPLAFGEERREGLVIAEVHPDGAIDRSRLDVHTTDMRILRLDISGCSNNSQVRELVRNSLRDQDGVIRLQVNGQVDPALDLRLEDLQDVSDGSNVILPVVGDLSVAYDIELIAEERTVRGEFVREVQTSDLPDEERRRVIVTGLRAFEGRSDLEVL